MTLPRVTIGTLCARIRRAPSRHLCAPHLSLLHSYLAGFAAAVLNEQVAVVIDELGDQAHALARRQLQSTLGVRDVPSGIGNTGAAQLLAADDRDALDRFFDMRESSARELAPTDAPLPEWRALHAPVGGLRASLETLRRRPGMYLGLATASALWTWLRGYLDAEIEHDVRSPDGIALDAFQAWVDEEHPYGRHVRWGRLFDLLPSYKGAIEGAFDSLDEFLRSRA